MGVHNNAHVPKESFPGFLWYAIEFFIVLGVAIGVAITSADYFTRMKFDESMVNWFFWGIVGVVFLVYYLIVRPLILRKPIFANI